MSAVFMWRREEKYSEFPSRYIGIGGFFSVCVYYYSRESLKDDLLFSCNAYIFIVKFLLLLLQYSPNIALEAYVIKAAGFTGMTCTVFQKVATSDRTGLSDYGRRDPDGNLDKQLSFKCNVSNTLSSLALKVGYSLFSPLPL